MRVLVVLLALSVICRAGEAMQVNGVRAYGRLHDVSVRDIRAAIAAIGAEHAASGVEVINNSEMHAYLRPRDLGWIRVRLEDAIEANGRKHVRWSAEGMGIDTPEVLRLIRTADEVYVFPVTTPRKPHRDDKHLRLLGPEARRKLVCLFGDQRSWWQGMYEIVIVEHEPTNLGFLFRRGGNEVLLFISRLGDEEGTFNGQHMSGLLDDKRGQRQMEE